MGRYSAKARQLKGRAKHSGPAFIQLFHYVKRSTAYHGLHAYARALLIELIDRYDGSNNGMIVLGVREAAYELGCHQSTVSRAAQALDDAGLARPTKLGAWRGRHATEWRLMWKRCDLTGDLPRTQWAQRKPFVQLLPCEAPKTRAKPAMTDAERARRYRQRKAEPEITEPAIDKPVTE